MKNNKEKILKQVYQHEVKKTFFDILLKIITLVFLILFSYLFLFSLVEILKEQRSFDLLFFFQENLEIFKKYFIENILLFFEEIPKLILLVWLILVVLIIKFIFNLKKNLKKTITKLRSIYKFFKKI